MIILGFSFPQLVAVFVLDFGLYPIGWRRSGACSGVSHSFDRRAGKMSVAFAIAYFIYPTD